jgi:ferredoxin
MTIEDKILDCSLNHFDVAGISPISNIESCLILGLESTSQRNLDEFEKFNKRLILRGFAQYIQPGLETIMTALKELGILAKPIGKYGYSSMRASSGANNFINMKNTTIKAGLGKRGKNTVVINPIFGPRLRFAALKLDTFLEVNKELSDEESPFCKDCSICIQECPVNVLEPYRMKDATKCLSNITNDGATIKDKKVILCDICLKKCPANKLE